MKSNVSRIVALFAPPSALAFLLLIATHSPELNSKTTANSPDDIEAAEYCVDCHEDYDTQLEGTPHSLTIASEENELSCVSCHSGAADHVEDPEEIPIGNPAGLNSGEVTGLCTQCHTTPHQLGAIGFDPHLSEDLGCANCHNIHQGQAGLLHDDKAEFCGKCHTAVTNKFQSRSNHPVGDDNMNCLSCHSFTGGGEPSVGHGVSANCYSCHPENSGPYIFEHDPANSFAVEGDGCITCHNPHGGPNDRLLKSSSDNLCLQCHATPPLHRIQHSGLGTKLACVECHSDIHGSNHNSKMLDPDLGVKLFPNCYQSGCHDAIQ